MKWNECRIIMNQVPLYSHPILSFYTSMRVHRDKKIALNYSQETERYYPRFIIYSGTFSRCPQTFIDVVLVVVVVVPVRGFFAVGQFAVKKMLVSVRSN